MKIEIIEVIVIIILAGLGTAIFYTAFIKYNYHNECFNNTMSNIQKELNLSSCELIGSRTHYYDIQCINPQFNERTRNTDKYVVYHFTDKEIEYCMKQ